MKLLRRATEPNWSWRCVPGETRLTTEPRWTLGPWPRHHLQMETHRATQDHAYCYNLHAVMKEGSAIAGKTVVPNNLSEYFAILPIFLGCGCVVTSLGSNVKVGRPLHM